MVKKWNYFIARKKTEWMNHKATQMQSESVYEGTWEVVYCCRVKWVCSVLNRGAVFYYTTEIGEKRKLVYECTVSRTEIHKLAPLFMDKWSSQTACGLVAAKLWYFNYYTFSASHNKKRLCCHPNILLSKWIICLKCCHHVCDEYYAKLLSTTLVQHSSKNMRLSQFVSECVTTCQQHWWGPNAENSLPTSSIKASAPTALDRRRSTVPKLSRAIGYVTNQ